MKEWALKYLEELTGTIIGFIVTYVEVEVYGALIGASIGPFIVIHPTDLVSLIQSLAVILGSGFVGGLGASLAKRLVRKYWKDKSIANDIDDD
jgi:hypothetical protein